MGYWNLDGAYVCECMYPCELASQGAARLPPRAPLLDTVEPWVVDDEYDPTDDFE